MDGVASELATRFAGRESELARAVSELRMRGAGELSLLPSSSSSSDNDVKTVQAALERVQQRVARARREAEAARAREETSSRVAELVALFLGGENEAELARRVAAGEAQLEGVKAFRMVREKVRAKEAAARKKEETEKGGGEKRVAATAAVVASSLAKMRESLALERTVVRQSGAAVLEAVAEVAQAAAERAKDETERRMVAEGAALVLAERFGREPQIPLYAALHYNSVMALAEGARKGEEEWRKGLEREAEKRLEAGTERVREEMKRHMAEVDEEGAREEDEGVRLVRAVKRCAHGLGMVRKAWSNVLEPETLHRVLCGDLVEWVLEAMTQRLMRSTTAKRKGDGLAKSGEQCLELMLPVLGLRKEASETERRSVGGIAWSRARKMVELLEGVELADLASNLNKLTSCFSKDELKTVVVNLYADGANRAALLNKL